MARVSEERTITERQFQTEINHAIANTEDEIFAEAMGDAQLDNDGDRSLEEMGDGLEGEHLDEEDVREEVDTELDPDGDEADGDQEDDGDEDGDEDADDQGERRDDRRDREEDRQERGRRQARADDERTDRARDRRDRDDRDDRSPDRDAREEGRERGRRGVPPWRLREEADGRRRVEVENEELRRQVAIANARLDDFNARLNANPSGQKKEDPEPDMFADPEGWKAWNRRQVETIADARAAALAQQWEGRQQQQMEQRVNQSFARAANSPGLRGMEFHAAYSALTSLDSRDPRNRELVASIYYAPDPSRALFDWFEEEGYAEDFREDLRSTLLDDRRGARSRNARPRHDERDFERDDRGRFSRDRDDRDYRDSDRGERRDSPRHEFRRRFNPPSLNGASGSGSRRAAANPDEYDNSEESVMEFALR
jgi:hypothetical protein